MQTIYEYTFSLIDEQTVNMPLNAIILYCGIQRESICLWALVDTEDLDGSRTFLIKGTGYQCDDVKYANYVGTVQLNGFVWHVFERR